LKFLVDTASRPFAQQLDLVPSCTVRTHQGMPGRGDSSKSLMAKGFGGRGRDRTGDPLLAKKAVKIK